MKERVTILVLTVASFGSGFFISRGHYLNEPEKANLLEENEMLWEKIHALQEYSMDLERICDRFQSSRNAKKDYHISKYPNYKID